MQGSSAEPRAGAVAPAAVVVSFAIRCPVPHGGADREREGGDGGERDDAARTYPARGYPASAERLLHARALRSTAAARGRGCTLSITLGRGVRGRALEGPNVGIDARTVDV